MDDPKRLDRARDFDEGVHGEIRRIIQKRYQRLARFAVHLFVFVVVTLIAVGNSTPLPPESMPLVHIGYVLWLVWLGVIPLHAVLVVLGEARDRALLRALEREQEWQIMMLRDTERRARLSDDGEVVYLDDAGAEPKRKREL